MSVAFIFPGQGSQAVGMGKALAEAHPAARAVFAEVDEALGEKLSALAFRGAARGADAHRECPARPDGGVARDLAGARSRGRPRLEARRQVRRRPFARRVFGARRGGRAQRRRHGAAAANPRARHAGGGAGRQGRDGGAARPRVRRRGRGRRRRPRRARCARRPTTTAPDSRWSRATRRRSSVRSRSPRPRAPSAP